MENAAESVPRLVDAPETTAALAALASGESLYEENEDDFKSIDAGALDVEDDDADLMQAMRKVQQVPPAGASGGPSVNDYYVPANAFDGNYKSWWAGKVDAKKWDLFYGFEATHYLDSLNLNFYGSDYIPGKVYIYVSADGRNWERVAKLKDKKKEPFNPDVVVSRNVRYIWIRMQGNPRSGFPLVRDIGWMPYAERVGAYAAPGSDDNWYFASNMFDGNAETLWAGEPAAGEWNVYYGFSESRFIGVVAVDLFSVNHRPADMELFVSADGEAWESLGSFGSVWPPAKFAGRQAKYFKITMTGNPPSGYPVVREITYDLPAGAFSAPDENPVSWPAANAFDGNLNTWWVGRQQAGAWDVYYGFAAPAAVGTITVNFYSVNHMPRAMELYTSSDGIVWTHAGAFPAGATPTLALNSTVKYLRFSMQGNPIVGYPLVRDIMW
jgi:hypothetical protein